MNVFNYIQGVQDQIFQKELAVPPSQCISDPKLVNTKWVSSSNISYGKNIFFKNLENFCTMKKSISCLRRDSNSQSLDYQSRPLTTTPQNQAWRRGSIMLTLFKKLKKSTFDKWNVWWWNSFGIYQLGVRNVLEGRHSKFFLENLILDTL